MPKGKTSTNQSLDRALDLLELLSTPNSSLNIAEIGKELSVSWATAQAIVDEREANGPFSSVEDIMRVSGIGDKKFAKLRESICV